MDVFKFPQARFHAMNMLSGGELGDKTIIMVVDLYDGEVCGILLADPPLVGSALHLLMCVCPSVRPSVRPQLTKLFNIFGST